MPASADVTTLIAALLGGGGGAALMRWRLLGAQREAVAVKTLRGVIHELRAELERKETELGRLRDRVESAENSLQKITEALALESD